MSTVRQRGDSWQALVRVKEGGATIHSEARTFAGPRAEKLAREWAERTEKSIKQTGSAQRELQVVTLGALIVKYGTAREAISPLRRSMAHELAQLSQAFGRTKLADLSARTLTKWAMERRAEGAGPATVLHNLATVRSVLNSAKAMFGVHVDGSAAKEAIKALSNLGAVSKPNERERRPSDDELDALCADFERIAHCAGTILPMAAIVRLAVALPRRIGELTAMTWSDYTNRVVTLRDTKNPSKPRTERVPVPPAAQALIAALPALDERILPYKAESISAAFQRCCERVGISDLHLHDLRHEGICRLFERDGLQIQEVALISGHLSWNMLKRYTHLRPQDVLERFK